MNRTLPLLAAALLLATPALSGKKDKDKDKDKGKSDEAPAAAQAPADAQAVVDYRHNLMEAQGKHMKLMSMIVKGQVDRLDDVPMHAAFLHDAAEAIPHLFPKGTDPGSLETDSKAEIWSDWDGFVAKNTEYEQATAKLVEVSTSGDLEAIKQAFGGVGRTCGGCHDGYRVDDD